MDPKQQTVGEIVAHDYRTALVFKKHGIDFCCGGRRSLDEACQSKGVATDAVVQELDSVETWYGTDNPHYDEWSASFLTDYIVNKHHLYVRHTMPQISEFAAKVARVHGERHPETISIFQTWEMLRNDLESHMQKEERILFPYIKTMSDPNPQKACNFGSVENPISVMETEHEIAGQCMHQIRDLSHDFTPPEDACTTYRVLYKLLADFEENLHEHVHLENNVLFPKAIALEHVSQNG